MLDTQCEDPNPIEVYNGKVYILSADILNPLQSIIAIYNPNTDAIEKHIDLKYNIEKFLTDPDSVIGINNNEIVAFDLETLINIHPESS